MIADDGRLTTLGGVAFALGGSRVLAGDASNLPRFESGIAGAAQTTAAAISWIVHGLFAVGLIASARHWLRKTSWRSPQSPADELRLVALLTVLLLMMMFAATHALAGPHYFNGTFAAYALLAWAGCGALNRRAGIAPALRLHTMAIATLTASLALSTLLCLTNLHQTQGRQTHYGPTIGAQRQALHELIGFGSRNCVIDVVQWHAFPFGPVALSTLDGREFGAKPRAANPPAVLAESEKTGRLRVTNALPADYVGSERRPLRTLDLGGPLTLQP